MGPMQVNNCTDSSNLVDECYIFDSLIHKRARKITQIRFLSQCESIWYYMGPILTLYDPYNMDHILF